MVEALRCCFQQGHQVDENLDNTQAPTWHQPLFIALSILGIIGLIIAGTGFAGFGAHQNWWAAGGLSNLSQIDGIIMMAVGGGLLSIIVGIAWIKQPNHTSSESTLNKIKEPQIADYPPAGKEAIEFAEKKLQESDLEDTYIGSPKSTYQSVDPSIPKLISLWNNLFREFQDTLKPYTIKQPYPPYAIDTPYPWSDPKVLSAADALIKVSYTLSCRTLEDLSAFTDNLYEKEGDLRTYAKALTYQDSYQYRTFFWFSQDYHMLRGAIVWGSYSPDELDLVHLNTGMNPENLPQSYREHYIPFYQNGTMQSKWRELYNDFCARVRDYVPEEELRRADNRHYTWTKKEEKPEDFNHTPDTLPT